MEAFEKALAHTLGIEGDYADHWADRGGKTRFGITEATARANGYDGVMAELPVELAKDIYRRDYWGNQVLPCQEIAEWFEPVALELFDSAVLHGPPQAARFLQEALNFMNRNESTRYFDDLKVDGWAGRVTVNAMRTLYHDRDVLVTMLNGLQAEFLFDLARRDPTQEWDMVGWIRHRVTLAAARAA